MIIILLEWKSLLKQLWPPHYPLLTQLKGQEQICRGHRSYPFSWSLTIS